MAKKKKEAVTTIEEPVDPSNLQPQINIGLVGHVDHGKTTLTQSLSGKWTDTHSEEIKRGITIRLGYADFTIYDDNGTFNTEKKGKLLRVASLVDAPGHESLMATMLAGATIMDGALLLVAANELCPQPQTREHLMALEIVGIKHVIVVQNKIDLVTEEQAKKNYHQIKEFLANSSFKDAPIIPISAQHRANVDLLLRAIQETIPTPKRNETKEPVMYIARSFDINKPGSNPVNIVGGVLGGSVSEGIFAINDSIEIRPGRIIEEMNKKVAKPLTTSITALMTGGAKVDRVHPGGSIGVMTSLDPSLVKSDALTGNLVGRPGKLPPIWYDLILETHLLERVVGAKEDLQVEGIKMGEKLMLNVNSAATVGIVQKLKKNSFFCNLKLPICAVVGARVTISRIIGTRFRLIGYGLIKDGKF